jgi:rhodanese-related sulfurtransferase
MQMKLVSAFAGFLVMTFAASACAQDNFDYTKLISKDGGVDGVAQIDVTTAYELHNKGVLFIDVNSPRRYKFAHIPGAIGLDFRTMNEEKLSEHATTDQMIVFYCPSKSCYGAAQASAKAITWGYTNVVIFKGGADAWKEAGYPIEGE